MNLTMAHRAGLVALVVAGLLAASASPAIAAHQDPRGWRLPFDNRDGGATPYAMYISNAPGFDTHATPPKDHDIDYAPQQGADRPARAPADGVVADILNAGSFGNVLVINHEGMYSFFGHLKTGSITKQVGHAVSQGEIVATIGDTGSPGALHLHFGARTGYVPGFVNSGSGLPILSVPGNWWYDCYAPPPNLAVCTSYGIFNGVAQYPARRVEPTWSQEPGEDRHLDNILSPTGPPSFYSTQILTVTAELNMGGNPSRPGTSHAVTFQIQRWNGSGWEWVVDTASASHAVFKQFGVDVEDYIVFASSSANGGSTWSSIEFAYQNSSGTSPHLASWKSSGESNATLEFEMTDKTWYQIERWNGAGWEIFYFGLGTQIGWGDYGANDGVPVQTGQCYLAKAWGPTSGWSLASPWVCI